MYLLLWLVTQSLLSGEWYSFVVWLNAFLYIFLQCSVSVLRLRVNFSLQNCVRPRIYIVQNKKMNERKKWEKSTLFSLFKLRWPPLFLLTLFGLVDVAFVWCEILRFYVDTFCHRNDSHFICNTQETQRYAQKNERNKRRIEWQVKMKTKCGRKQSEHQCNPNRSLIINTFVDAISRRTDDEAMDLFHFVFLLSPRSLLFSLLFSLSPFVLYVSFNFLFIHFGCFLRLRIFNIFLCSVATVLSCDYLICLLKPRRSKCISPGSFTREKNHKKKRQNWKLLSISLFSSSHLFVTKWKRNISSKSIDRIQRQFLIIIISSLCSFCSSLMFAFA